MNEKSTVRMNAEKDPTPKGIDPLQAVELTVRYTQSLLIILFNTSPKEPWET